MKKFLCVLSLLVLAAVGLRAQGNDVAAIRKLYAAAKERIERNGKDEAVPRYDVTVNSHYVVPGSGPTEETIRYFFGTDFDEEAGMYVSRVYFITRRFNVAARPCYQEFLYDEESGDLVFAFLQEEGFDGASNQTRYYWNKSGLVQELVKGERVMDEVFTNRLANDLMEAFHRLMNREF